MRTLDAVTQFRLLYMQSIAHAWLDAGFRDALTSGKPGAAVDALNTRFSPGVKAGDPGAAWPWHNSVDLFIDYSKKFLWTGTDWYWPQEGTIVLSKAQEELVDEERADRQAEADDVKDGPSEEQAGDDDSAPVAAVGETLTEDVLKLYIPRRVRSLDGNRVDPALHPAALADYYRQRPSLFGDDDANTPIGTLQIQTNPKWSHFENALPSTLAPSPESAVFFGGNEAYVSAGAKPPPGGFVPSRDGFFNFAVVLLTVMAKAWGNIEFAKLLRLDPAAGFLAVRGFKSPWKLAVKIKYDYQARWKGPDYVGDDPWYLPKKHELRLHMPAAPSEVKDRAVALATYNATGAEYPFSCCVCC